MVGCPAEDHPSDRDPEGKRGTGGQQEKVKIKCTNWHSYRERSEKDHTEHSWGISGPPEVLTPTSTSQLITESTE